ncbi:MAG: ATP-binding protein [Butyrivibrio sp.]|nr:ATP-binding protein [Butyrivibrio sp.]
MSANDNRDIVKRIEALTKGSITTKRINGREYEYWQYPEDGKQKTKRVKGEELEVLRGQIDERKRLEKLLKTGRNNDYSISPPIKVGDDNDYTVFVRMEEELSRFVKPVKEYKKRECIKKIERYIYGSETGIVLVLYGLRRTGKTTMIKQLIGEMSKEDFDRTVFIQVKAGDTLEDVHRDIRLMEKRGYKYVFIDEVTLMEEFIENAAVFSDIFASSGMKIVLSGTDSLGFLFTMDEQLYDRAVMVHTTFIPYKEFEEVLGKRGIDEYIRYSGTMSIGGFNFNEENGTFSNIKSTNEYVDSAIAQNIQHSLKFYQYGGHFRGLTKLYESGELTNVINRIIEDMNHRFAIEVIEERFKSHDFGISKNNLRRDKENPTDLLDLVDVDALTERLKSLLYIIEKEDASVEVTYSHIEEIQQYLHLLDLVTPIDIVSVADGAVATVRNVFTQPGLRYSQAQSLITSIIQDDVFGNLGVKDRSKIIDRILDEIRGRMMEEIVLLETQNANPNFNVFVLQFEIGEFDMVVFDPLKLCCRIYEIKHSNKAVPEQARHLLDKKKLSQTEKRYGDILGKYVIYTGKSGKFNSVDYVNVEEYLKGI